MMLILGGLVLAILILGGYFVYRYLAGRRISKSMMLFIHSYDTMIKDGMEKEESFFRSLNIFKETPPFRSITESQWEEVTDMFIQVEDPKDAFLRLMMVPSRKVMRFLNDPDGDVIDELSLIDIEGMGLQQGVKELTTIIDRSYSEY